MLLSWCVTHAVPVSPNVLLPDSPKFWDVLLYRTWLTRVQIVRRNMQFHVETFPSLIPGVSPKGLRKYFLVQYDDSPAKVLTAFTKMIETYMFHRYRGIIKPDYALTVLPDVHKVRSDWS